jgi:hypothetical protein
LTSLGWSAREADQAIEPSIEPRHRHQERPDVGALLKAALRTLDRS